MKTARTALILAGVTVGLLTTAGTGTALAASPVSIGAPTAVSAPLDNDGHGHDRGGDRGRSNGGGRDHDWKGGNDHWRGGHDRGWNNNNYRWHWDRHDNHNRNWNWDWYTVSPSKCRNGGGHVEHHQCDGGRYDGRWIR
jgi:hypothetical protein